MQTTSYHVQWKQNWPIELENRILKPNYFYQPDPWKTESEPQGCPLHQQSTIPTTQQCPVYHQA